MSVYVNNMLNWQHCALLMFCCSLSSLYFVTVVALSPRRRLVSSWRPKELEKRIQDINHCFFCSWLQSENEPYSRGLVYPTWTIRQPCTHTPKQILGLDSRQSRFASALPGQNVRIILILGLYWSVKEHLLSSWTTRTTTTVIPNFASFPVRVWRRKLLWVFYGLLFFFCISYTSKKFLLRKLGK